MMLNNKRKGVSLVVLLITIIILIILSTTVILNSDDSRIVARKTSLVADYSTVQDAVRSYYVLNGSMPTPDVEKKVYTYEEIVSLNSDDRLLAEISSMNDDSASFYIVDLSLLDISNVKMGLKYEEAGSKDVFVVSSPNLNIYYLKGERLEGVLYYSLSSALTSATEYTDILEDDSYVEIGSVTKGSRINVINSNILNLRAVVKLEQSEEVEIRTTNNSIFPEVSVGDNILIITNLLTDAQLEEIKTSGSFDLKIKKSGNVIETKNITVSTNASSIAFSSEADIVKYYTNENTVTFSFEEGSKVEYIKYEKYNVFDANEVNGYALYKPELDTETKWVDYVKSYGKQAFASSNLKCTISVDKSVKDIFVIAVDSSGNVIKTVKNVCNFNAKSSLLNKAQNDLKITNNIVAPISSLVNVKYSLDGINYIDLDEYTVSNAAQSKELLIEDIYQDTIYVKTILTVSGDNYEFIDKINTKM